MFRTQDITKISRIKKLINLSNRVIDLGYPVNVVEQLTMQELSTIIYDNIKKQECKKC